MQRGEMGQSKTENDMTKLLALTALAALLTACAGMDGGVEAARAEATRHDAAAFLGYHGPVERMTSQYGN